MELPITRDDSIEKILDLNDKTKLVIEGFDCSSSESASILYDDAENQPIDFERDLRNIKLELKKKMKKKTFTDDDILIVGHTDIMHAIEQSFVNSTLSPELRWKAILLAGLPGTGKSTIMSSVAIKIAKLKKTTVSVFKVRTGDLFKSYLGQSEKTPEALYSLAREEAPSIVLIDEIDGIMRSRSDTESDQSRRFKTTLLAEMDGAENLSNVLTICATNRPGDLDSSFIRRFGRIFCAHPPSFSERVLILRKYLQLYHETVPVNFDQLDLDAVARRTEGFTGDGLKNVVIAAANSNCKIFDDDQLFDYKNIESFRAKIEKSPIPLKTVAVPMEGSHLLQACESVSMSYKKRDVKLLVKFERDYLIPQDNQHKHEDEKKNYSAPKSTTDVNCQSDDEQFDCYKMCNQC